MLISLAVDHRHADVATRERFHLTDERMASLFLPHEGTAAEIVGVATCNRSEVYAWIPDPAPQSLEPSFQQLARRWMGNGRSARAFLAIARRRTGEAAVRHLFRVAAGIESQVLGDAQLLGQLRDAHAHAAKAHATGSVLHRLFETALRVGKRVRSETALSSGRYSVGAEAANVAARRFGSLTHARIAIVGCGKTGERVARQLVKLGARDLVLVNRTLARAETLASTLRGRPATLDALYGELALADIGIVATASQVPVVYADPLVSARRRFATSHYPLLLFDLSVPRNVDPAVAQIPGAVIVDLDALRPAVAAGDRDRLAAVPNAESIVDAEVRDFMAWLRASAAREAIRPLSAMIVELCEREVAFASGNRELAERAAARIAAKLLARPMTELRGAVARGESVGELTAAIARLFPPAPSLAADPLVSPIASAARTSAGAYTAHVPARRNLS